MASCRHRDWRHMRLMKKIKLVGRKISISLLHRMCAGAPIVTAVCLATILHFQPAYVHLLSGVLLMCACITHLQSHCFAQGHTLSCNGSLMMTLEDLSAHGIVHSIMF